MKAIILAAGIGSRIRPLTDHQHKSLLKIGSKSILERMIENIEKVGINEILIITGYLDEQVKAFVGERFPHLNVQYIKNEKYLETNTGYSLLLARNFAAGDTFIKFDADVVFEEEVLRRLVESEHETGLCIDRNIHLDKEEVKVITDPVDVDKVLEVGKKLEASKCKGESIGIEKISAEAGHILFNELAELMEDKRNFQEYYDDSYTTLVNRGVPFYAIDITGLNWVEIDTHEDHQRALELFVD